MPYIVDGKKVEQAKILKAMGKSRAQISREVGMSERTIGRYLEYEDDPEFAEELAEIRRANQHKFVTDAWNLIHKAMDKTDEDIPNMRGKDTAVVAGIMLDKVRLMESSEYREVKTTDKIEFVLKLDGESLDDANSGGTLPDADTLSQFPGPVSGDDSGGGERQNVFPLPGNDEAGDREPRHKGDAGSGELQEP